MVDEFIIKKGLIVGPLTFPATDGGTGTAIITDGSGNLAWSTTAVDGGGGSEERFKVNYLANGDITSITDDTADVSVVVTDAVAGVVEVTFANHDYPPSGITVYGYSQSTDKYVIVTTIDATWTNRTIDGGGATAFGAFSGKVVELTLSRDNTGSSASFGQGTHAFLMFNFGD